MNSIYIIILVIATTLDKQVQINAIKPTPCPKFCPEGYQPVCGTDHITYNNWCLLAATSCRKPNADQIAVTHSGACYVKRCPWSCDQINSPVCGSDGVTYGNLCELEKVGCGISAPGPVVLLHEGSCERDWCKKPCPLTHRPVCGSNNVTYENECALRMSNCKKTSENPITVWYEGECRELGCDRPCPMIFRPLCGTDGVTYPNSCAMEEALCRNKTELSHEGVCNKTDPVCPIVCIVKWNPVCGSDGVTYPSRCYLDGENCDRNENDKIRAKNEGPCANSKPKCPLVCSDVYQPVCGSDDVTYNSACFLEQENCDAFQPGVKIVKAGVCARGQ